jgi:hypothetical protein
VYVGDLLTSVNGRSLADVPYDEALQVRTTVPSLNRIPPRPAGAPLKILSPCVDPVGLRQALKASSGLMTLGFAAKGDLPKATPPQPQLTQQVGLLVDSLMVKPYRGPATPHTTSPRAFARRVILADSLTLAVQPVKEQAAFEIRGPAPQAVPAPRAPTRYLLSVSDCCRLSLGGNRMVTHQFRTSFRALIKPALLWQMQPLEFFRPSTVVMAALRVSSQPVPLIWPARVKAQQELSPEERVSAGLSLKHSGPVVHAPGDGVVRRRLLPRSSSRSCFSAPVSQRWWSPVT